MSSLPPGKPRRNIELKAKLESLSAAREVARRLTGAAPEVELQTDTYFAAAIGRLKLRERKALPAQLVWYARPDGRESKPSDYLLAPVADAVLLKQALTAAYGVLVVVAKRREIYLHENVRIHLDQVSGLGDFLEFEAVLSPGDQDDAGHAMLSALSRRFAIGPRHLVAESYSDRLLVEQSRRG
jgi:predicted adenylyl cyclase CyaB